ncbi:MAG: aminodeoxychorismate synthase component I [Candidatus Omnitrophota bacterium]
MNKRRFQPIIEDIKDPAPPETLFAGIKNNPYSFFLDSSSDSGKLGRFSFFGCDPFLIFSSKGTAITLERTGIGREHFSADPFMALRDILKRYETAGADGLPFTSGGVGYFAYDMKEFVERLPASSVDDLGIPDCMIGFYDRVVIYDNLEGRCRIASSGLPETDQSRRNRRAVGRIKEFKDIIDTDEHGSKTDMRGSSYGRGHHSPLLKSNFSFGSYIEAIRRAKEYIKKGDIYQVNLSQRFEAGLDHDPFELYSRLRRVSPAPFSAYLGFGGVTVASSSPERFLMKRGGYIETRPIKGTRPRGDDTAEDARLEGELLASAKDRAEHVMIVDLERNDLGRICEYGSIRPTEFVILEKYATVSHLVSTVSGRLRDGIDPIDCLLATFPGGSITGAPKIRSMEIIDELEPVRRSVYTGSIGYISFDGNMDTSIAIRTFLIKGDKAYFQVGGGIVADSDPESEYLETLDKAKGMFRALGVAMPKREHLCV